MSPLVIEEKNGRLYVQDPTGSLNPARIRLGALGVYSILGEGRWGMRDPSPLRRQRLETLLEQANRGALPPADPTPRANSRHVELAEANGYIYVSGPVHVMLSSVITRLKSQGFQFDSATRLWSLPEFSLTARQRANLLKLIAPYSAGGGADLRTHRQKAEDEIRLRRSQGLCLKIPYELKDEAKSRGGLWDEASGTWCMPDSKTLAEVRALHEDTPKVRVQKELARRKTEGLGVQIPYEQRGEAKSRGGLWDEEGKRWYMPDANAKRETLGAVRQVQEGARAVAQQDLHPGTRALYMPGDSQGDHPAVGSTFRDRKTGDLVEVMAVSSTYYPEDGLSFGLPDDKGWMHEVRVRPSQDAAAILRIHEKDKERVLRGVAFKRRAELVRRFTERGEQPPGPVDLMSDRRWLVGDAKSILYGGGSWFHITPQSLWYVQNNGADGDLWDRNNLTTGGAGARGWRLSYDEALAQEIRDLDGLVGESD